jgi:hypothetical protein
MRVTRPIEERPGKPDTAQDVSRRIEELIETEREQQKQALAEAAAKYEVTAERVIGELAKIGFANTYV